MDGFNVLPPENRKADFLYASYILASLRPGGIKATVMPHGVLLWSSGEYEIHRNLSGLKANRWLNDKGYD